MKKTKKQPETIDEYLARGGAISRVGSGIVAIDGAITFNRQISSINNFVDSGGSKPSQRQGKKGRQTNEVTV